ncbi:hypothetical protein QJS04_geneDACA023239 [Acorus gramineus]|uniref:DUF8039 domain-containing protein n=1 Tax=Acorus gramineus TaxID=55184 RepID=A0AAV9AKM3_ACOGR|nr:hypothetical protein QJS04_geneDACA023239 [Acorus gramineus]
MVSITYANWHKVPTGLKEKIWTVVMSKYEVEDFSKAKIIQLVGAKWKAFKKDLNKKYICPAKGNEELLKHPPCTYNFIEQADWDQFVRTRLTKEFQDLSKKQSERRAKNIYSHRISRKGYANLQEELGKVFDVVEPNETIHTIRLGENNRRVSIEIALSPYAPLPIPVGDEMITVMEDVGSFVEWPKDLIVTDVQVNSIILLFVKLVLYT